MSGFCSAHKHYELGCKQCEADRNCYNCGHCEMNKYYECFCHLNIQGAFCEQGTPVASDYVCESWIAEKLLEKS